MTEPAATLVRSAYERMIARRAAKAGITVGEYRARIRAEQDRLDELNRLCRSRSLQRAVITEYAARHGRRFEVHTP